jgi:hypothetical protein
LKHTHDIAAPCPDDCPAFSADEKRCGCGCPMLADTEDWSSPLCVDCWEALGSPSVDPDVGMMN